MRLLLIGHAPAWAAFFLWLVVTSAAAVLWRAIIRHTERERVEHQQRRDQLDDLDERLRVIENYLFPPDATEDNR